MAPSACHHITLHDAQVVQSPAPSADTTICVAAQVCANRFIGCILSNATFDLAGRRQPTVAGAVVGLGVVTMTGAGMNCVLGGGVVGDGGGVAGAAGTADVAGGATFLWSSSSVNC